MSPVVRPCRPKSLREIAAEWDAIASTRLSHHFSHDDISFDEVLLPTLFELIGDAPFKRVLDIGCGVGVLTRHLGERFPTVVGVDPSAVSVTLARSYNAALPNVSFNASSLESYARRPDTLFDLLVANMTFMGVPELRSAIDAAASLSAPGATLLLSVTHPCFWPQYWGYADETWFHYSEEIFLEAMFTISRAETNYITTHVHRPLTEYVEALAASGFALEQIREPLPTTEVEGLYPERWQYPRFLLCRCRKT